MHHHTSSKLTALFIGFVSFFAVLGAYAAGPAVFLSQPGNPGAYAASYSVSEAQGTFLLPVTLATALKGGSATVLIATQDVSAVNGTNYGSQAYTPGTLVASISGTTPPASVVPVPPYSGTYSLTWTPSNVGAGLTQYVSIPIFNSGLANASPVQFNAFVVSGALTTAGSNGNVITNSPMPLNSASLWPLYTGTGPSTLGGQALVTILGAQAATTTTIKMHNSDYIVREPAAGSGTATVAIDFVRSGDPNQTVSVQFSCVPGTALPGVNYTAVSGTASVTGTTVTVRMSNGQVFPGYAPVGSGTAFVNIPLLHSALIPTTTPQFTFTLTSPQNGTITRQSAVIEVLDVDTKTAAVSFANEEFFVTQGAGSILLPIYQTGTVSGGTFSMNVYPGSAAAGTDYLFATGTTPTTLTLTGSVPSTSGSITILTGQTIQPLYFTASLTGSASLSGTTVAGDVPQCTVYIQTAAAATSTVEFSSPVYVVSQAAGSISTAELLVQRVGNLDQMTTVSYMTVPGSAQSGIDFMAAMGTLVFAPGDTSKTIDITINPSSTPTGQISFSVALSNVSSPGAVGSGTSVIGSGASTATVMISPNAQVNVVSFPASSYAVANSGTSFIGVQLDRGATTQNQTVTVQLYTEQGTAVAGGTLSGGRSYGDYLSISQTAAAVLSFTGGQTFATGTIVTFAPTAPQDTRYFDLTLVNPVNALLGTQSQAEIDIDSSLVGSVQFSTTSYLVSEGAGSITLYASLLRTGSDSVSVPYAIIPGTASAAVFQSATGGTVTFGAGSSQATIVIPIVDSHIVHPPQTFSVNLLRPIGGAVTLGQNFSAQVTVTCDNGDNTVAFEDAVYGTTAPSAIVGTSVVPVRVVATRNGSLDVSLAVDYQLVANTATANVDYVWNPTATHTITFAPGESVADIPITILTNAAAVDTSTFFVNLIQNQTAGTFTGIGAQSSALFKIYPANVAVNQIQFLTPEIATTEGGPAVIIPVIRNGPYNQNNSTVSYTTRQAISDANPYGDTAVPNRDYTPQKGTLTFNLLRDGNNNAIGQDALQYIAIPITDNGLITGQLFFTIWITSVNNAAYGSQLSCRVDVNDAELGNQVQFQQTDFPVVRSGTVLVNGTSTVTGTSAATVVVTLNPTGNANITNTVNYKFIDITAINGVDYHGSDGTLIFSPSDFTNLQSGSFPTKTITIPLDPNALFVGQSKQFGIALLNPSSGVVISQPSTATVTISDPYLETLPTVNITVPNSNAIISETGTLNGIFTISETGLSTTPLTVNYVIKGGATPGPITLNPNSGAYDYQWIGNPVINGSNGIVASGSIVIPAGVTTGTIPLVPHYNQNSSASVTVLMQVDVAPPNPSDPFGRPSYIVGPSSTGTVTLNPTAPAGLGVTIQASDNYPQVGDQIFFTMTLNNTVGSADQYDVVLTQTLPAGVEYLGSTWGDAVTTATTNGVLTLTVPLGIVQGGTSAVVKTSFQMNSPVTFDTTAQITSLNPDPYLNDDSATTRVSVASNNSVPNVSIAGAGDAYELTPLVGVNGQTSYTYLGPLHGSFMVMRTGDLSLPMTVQYALGGDAFTPDITSGSAVLPTVTSGTTAMPGVSYRALSTNPTVLNIPVTGTTTASGSFIYVAVPQALATGTIPAIYQVGSMVIPSGTNSGTIRVEPFDNGQVEGNQSVTLNLWPDSSYAITSPSNASIAIHDADVPGVGVKALPTSISAEQATMSGSGVFRVYRYGSSGNTPTATGFDLPVNMTIGGTALNEYDYQIFTDAAMTQELTGNSVIIPAGADHVDLYVATLFVSLVNGNKTVTFTVTAATPPANNGTTIQQTIAYSPFSGQTVATMTIADPDMARIGVSVVTGSGLFSSGNVSDLNPWVAGSGTFRLTRYDLSGTNAMTTIFPVTVNISVLGAAIDGFNYDIYAGSRLLNVHDTAGVTATIPANTDHVDLIVVGHQQPLVNGPVDVIMTVLQATTQTGAAGQSAAYIPLAQSVAATITIVDPDMAYVGVTAVGKYASELSPKTNATMKAGIRMAPYSGYFNVVRYDALSNPNVTNFPLVVNYDLGGTAATGTDYNIFINGVLSNPSGANNSPDSASLGNGGGTKTTTPGTITIPAGASSAVLEVRPISNAIIDYTRTVVLHIENPALVTQKKLDGITFAPPSAYAQRSDLVTDTVYVLDKPTVYLSQFAVDRSAYVAGTTGRVVSGGQNGRITVNREGSGLGNAIRVPFTVGGMAKLGTDYRLHQDSTSKSAGRWITDGEVTIPANLTSVTVQIVPINHSHMRMVDPMILTVSATSYFQCPATSRRASVNILSFSTN